MPVVVTLRVSTEDRSRVEEPLRDVADVVFLRDLPENRRRQALGEAEAMLVWRWNAEVRADERDAVADVRFVQLASAGADAVPFDDLPPSATVASNVGAYAEPMAEHVLAMALALAKRLSQRHAELARGQFNMFALNRSLAGGVCAIVGFGGIGNAVARLMRGIGMRIHAINTSGRTDDAVEFIGTLDDLERVLRDADVLVLSVPLTKRTRGLIGARELGAMKHDAILVNVARGAVIEEAALYEHLKRHRDFMAGIDAWWDEPGERGEFRTRHPFFDLPNFLGSPHNSALVPGAIPSALRHAAENVARFIRGDDVRGVVRREDYV